MANYKQAELPAEFQERILGKMHLYSYSTIKENRRFNRLLEEYDIPYQTYQVLSLLLSHPEGVEPSKIAGTFSILRQTVTNIADAMEKRGYVERVRSETDRRSIYLRLMPEGIRVTQAMRNDIESYHRRVMVNFNEKELEDYFAFRKKLLECLDAETEATMARKKQEKSEK